tara:strand:- start:419 stop:1429 length:1011 start_codon:yes stop_codon:yes gene_type:complete
MKTKNILVTGGLGLIGSTLIKHLNNLNANDKIICVDTFSNNQKWKYLREIIVDELICLEEFDENKNTLIDNADEIFHLGACSSTTEENWKYLYKNNYRCTIDIIDLFKKSKQKNLNSEKKLVIASSAATYGDGASGFKDELGTIERLRPLNPYGMSKQLVDIYLKRKDYFSDVLSLKFFNIFGLNEFHKGSMRSIAHWGVESIIQNKSIKLFKSENPNYADGNQVRDFLDVDTAVEIMIFLAQKTTGIHNIGCGETITWREMANTIIDTLSNLDKKYKLEFVNMPCHLKNKYQYFTCAEMSRGILPENLLPNKKRVLKKLSEYSIKLFNEYKEIKL